MAMGLLTSCKKEQLHSGIQLNSEHKLSATTGADIMAPYRSLSPYSAKVVRVLRAKVAASGDAKFIAAVNKSLKLSNTQLYYKIEVTNETHANALNTWLTDTDYIGNTFAFMRYGTGVNATEINRWMIDDANTQVDEREMTSHYQGLLERVPTFFNDFIPLGLFSDLTDAGNNEDFDRIQGFTTNDIYQKLNPTMYTIQQFRTRWENDHPNANNNALFNWYDVN